MIKTETLYSLRDISIIPAVKTSIKSRKDCNPFCNNIEGTKDKFLPLIVSPMSCVLENWKDDWKILKKTGLSCIVPRTVNVTDRIELMNEVFCAFSLSEAEDLLSFPKPENKYYVLLDMANGHMKEQLTLGEKLKDKFGDSISLMGGNIANPETYLLYERAGFDYIRVGIGGGSGCLTSTNTGVHYPMASLIDNIVKIRPLKAKCKIVADGGISSYSEIIKCLALGADYVMCGKIFAKAAIHEEDLGKDVEYYGMSTKRAQAEMGSKTLKTSEGKSVNLKKEYTLSGWVENMTDYLRSAMSYCNSRTLNAFRNNSVCQVISPNSSSNVNDK